MKTLSYFGSALLFFSLLIAIIPFQSCEPEDELDEPCDSCYMVEKPNIYIYPTEQIQLTVEINFPLGGNVVTSIPEYGTGWNVTVDTAGFIDNTYSYLFYESIQPDVWQSHQGWIIETEKLASFFRENMTAYGFNETEIKDFLDYWIPRFTDYSLYSIYPQTKGLIDDVIQLDFSKSPDNLLRLFYVVMGHNQLPDKLAEPTIDNFKREGYFVTEWGVVQQ